MVAHRRFLSRSNAAGLAVVAALVLSACGSDAATSTTDPPGTSASSGSTTPETSGDSGATTPESGEGVSGGTLNVAVSLEPDTLDLGGAAQAASQQIGRQIYDTLIWLDPETREYVPGLATSWTSADDGLTYTFTLRDDVTFHDGTTFDADAVKFAFDRILDPEFTSPTARAKLGPVESVNVVDATTVEIVLTSAFPSLLNSLSQGWLGIPSPTAIEKYGDTYGQNPVGTGPMSFVEWIPGDSVTLHNNPDYNWAPEFLDHQGPAYLDTLVFKVVGDNVARPAALESGDVQVAWNMPAADFDRLKDAGGELTMLNTPWSGATASLFLNTEKAPTDDLAVRQAVLYGLDRESLIDTALFGAFDPSQGPISPITVFYSDKVEGLYPYDPDKAAELLEGAGWTMDGDVRKKDGVELALHIITSDQFKPIATTIQGLLAPLGFKVEVDVRDPAGQVSGNSNGEGTGGITGLVDSDASGIQLFWRSTNYGSFNWSRVKDPALDALLDAQSAELDEAARTADFADLQVAIMDKALIYPIYQGAFLWGIDKSVQGFRTDLLAYPYYYDVWLDS